MAGFLFSAIGKLVSTVVLALGLCLLSIYYWPTGLLLAQDLASLLHEKIRAPAFLDQRQLAFYRQLVGDTTILGIFVTAIARLLVEALAYTGGALLHRR